MKILVTRPRADAEDLSKLLAARGHDVLIEPLLDIVMRPGEPVAAGALQALIFTSANGVRALLARNQDDIAGLRALPVYTVGDATARAAKAAGFAEIVSASGDVNSLAALIAARVRPEAGPLLHVAGSDVAGDLAGQLGAQGFAVERIALYEAQKAVSLSAEAAEALKRGDVAAALFFSPRTAAAFVGLAADIAPALGRCTAICLSPAVAKAADDLPGAASWRDILTAAEPTQDSLLAALDRFAERETRPKGEFAAAAAPPSGDAADGASPLPPPIFPRGRGHGPAPAAERPSWRGRLALALVVLLVGGGGALYLAKPAALQRALAFDWLPSWDRSTARETATPAEPASPQPTRSAAEAEPSGPALPDPGDTAAVIDALRRELALTTARLREAEREPIVTQPYEAPAAEPSPEMTARLEDIESRLGRLAERPVVAPDALRDAADAVSSRLTRLDDTLSALTQKFEAQSAAQEAERARAARVEALAFSALALRESLDAGTPFAGAIAGLRPLAQELGLAAEADRLAPAAATGLASAEQLRAQLMALIPEVMRAEAGPPDSGLLARLWRSLSAGLVVRRVADDAATLNAADPADRLLSRAERRLAAGDLDEAIAPVELLASRDSLTAHSRQALQDWIADARARRAAERLAAALLQSGLAARADTNRGNASVGGAR
ncbi:MAG: uroporphyrinogen-III synthase [Alphaproteobacteria bacterium]